jgi:hypothetical protein
MRMTASDLVGKITRRKLLAGSAAAFVTTFLPPLAGSRRAIAGSCCGTCCCVNFVDCGVIAIAAWAQASGRIASA